MNRRVVSYGYLTTVAGLVVVFDLVTRGVIARHVDNVATVAFLGVSLIAMGAVNVPIERGRFTLSGLPVGAAALLLNPIDATLVGMMLGIPTVRRGAWAVLVNTIVPAAYAAVAAAVGRLIETDQGLSFGQRVVVVVVMDIVSWVLLALAFAVRTGESAVSIVRHNFTPSFYVAYGYFGLASILISYQLDSSPKGYLLAAIVCVLALALTDTIAGRRIRRVLESELSDADRHLFHSRAVEGVVHNLRNHIASAVGYLKEIDLNRLDPVDREAVETATAAANDAVTVLRTLSQGATPRVSYSPAAVDLNELVVRALGMARPRARAKEIELGLRETPDEVNVRADPLLLREVLTNLINNAIDAAPKNGRVDLVTGRRSNGWPYVSVADNGPGVSEDNRHHLFEPHFTTKESGTGLGLFMSYGIIREHQGEVLFSNNRPRGAVFTVVLPPFRD